MPKYKADAYLRISCAADGSVESDSIANQKKLIEAFVEARPDIELVSERVDDGYSGVLFDRPAFQEMMRDIESGKINCVIVKDSCGIIGPNQKDTKMLGLSGLVPSFLTEKRTIKTVSASDKMSENAEEKM